MTNTNFNQVPPSEYTFTQKAKGIAAVELARRIAPNSLRGWSAAALVAGGTILGATIYGVASGQNNDARVYESNTPALQIQTTSDGELGLERLANEFWNSPSVSFEGEVGRVLVYDRSVRTETNNDINTASLGENSGNVTVPGGFNPNDLGYNKVTITPKSVTFSKKEE